MRWGFKTRAKRLALEVRTELELSPLEPLDPWALADLYGIPVYGLNDLIPWGYSQEALLHFTDVRQDAFSAALIPCDTARIIIENTSHAPVRRKANVTHEMAHVILEHEFGEAVLFADGCRVLDSEIEEEATWLAGEFLIPSKGALWAARQQLSDEVVAQRFGVSPSMAAMRMNASGARKRAKRERDARARRRREP
jgi:Zn-dependent peptidase ImmA (M78 family)